LLLSPKSQDEINSADVSVQNNSSKPKIAYKALSIEPKEKP